VQTVGNHSIIHLCSVWQLKVPSILYWKNVRQYWR